MGFLISNIRCANKTRDVCNFTFICNRTVKADVLVYLFYSLLENLGDCLTEATVVNKGYSSGSQILTSFKIIRPCPNADWFGPSLEVLIQWA